MARFCPQLGQGPLDFHENGSNFSWPQSGQRILSHPGYLGAVVSCLFGMCILGSLGAMLPIGVLLLLMLRRAKLEDRFLHEELEGYREYAQRVRYRLIPGLW